MFDLTDDEFVIFDNEGYDEEFSRKCEKEKNDYLIWGI